MGFLVKLATEAVESNMPDLMTYDSQGKSVQGPSPEFVAWAEAHNIKQGAAALRIFLNIASTHPDYDVRAYASFRSAQLYLEQGDYWGAAGQAAWVFNPKASVAVQSN